MTSGSIAKNIVLFALPLLGSSLVQQLYDTVDLLFAGNVISQDAVAAIGVSSLLIRCIVSFLSGLSVGATIVVARHFGAGETDLMDKSIRSSVSIGIWGGIVFSIAGWLFAPLYIQLLGTPEQIAGLAVTYLRVYFIACTFAVLYNMCAGVMRALGDSRTPLIVQLVGGVVNVAADAVVLLVFDAGIAGIAWATLASQGVAAILMLFFLSRAGEVRAKGLGLVQLDREQAADIIRYGIPVGLQSVIITVTNMFVQSAINTFGPDTIAAYAAYQKIELIIFLPIASFGQAITAFVGQNLGAKQVERVERGTRLCLLIGFITSVCLIGVCFVFGRQLFTFFGAGEAAITDGLTMMSVVFPFYWLYVGLEVFAGSIRGSGQTVAPMVIVILNVCVFRIILLTIVMHTAPSLQAVAACIPITWTTDVISFALYYRLKTVPSNRRKIAASIEE